MAQYKVKNTYMAMFHCGLERNFRDEKERITFDKLHHKVCLVCKNFVIALGVEILCYGLCFHPIFQMFIFHLFSVTSLEHIFGCSSFSYQKCLTFFME